MAHFRARTISCAALPAAAFPVQETPMTERNFSRRSFLSQTLLALPAAGGLLLVGRSAIACSPPKSGESSRGGAPACPDASATEANIEGPYYRGGAPFRADLREPGIAGVPLAMSGSILSLDCRSPLEGAVLDVWQADGDGHYDNDGSLRLARDAMRLRGKVRADARGAFSFHSVLPGRYLNGRTYRPAHIHVKASAPGHATLTTQLYFPDDPFNEKDPFIRKSLIMDVGQKTGNAVGHFDFVLTPLPRTRT
jgi:catechol 1,2-dioxygenase